MAPQSSDRLDELVALSAEIGDPAKDYVILSEGNTSARISEHSFWVKGSGIRLEHACGPQAFVAMELEPLMRARQHLSEPEIAAVTALVAAQHFFNPITGALGADVAPWGAPVGSSI